MAVCLPCIEALCLVKKKQTNKQAVLLCQEITQQFHSSLVCFDTAVCSGARSFNKLEVNQTICETIVNAFFPP